MQVEWPRQHPFKQDPRGRGRFVYQPPGGSRSITNRKTFQVFPKGEYWGFVFEHGRARTKDAHTHTRTNVKTVDMTVNVQTNNQQQCSCVFPRPRDESHPIVMSVCSKTLKLLLEGCDNKIYKYLVNGFTLDSRIGY